MLSFQRYVFVAATAIALLVRVAVARAEPPSGELPVPPDPPPSETSSALDPPDPWDAPGPPIPRPPWVTPPVYATGPMWAEYASLPPGRYRLETQAWEPPIVAGAITLGSAYLLSGIGAAFAQDQGALPLFIPIVGPWITLGVEGSSGQFDSAGLGMLGAVLVFDGLAQAGGVVLMIVGATHRKTVPVNIDTTPQVGIAGDRIVIQGHF
jgi:hypothetical protein